MRYSQTAAFGFAVTLGLAIVISAVAYYGMRAALASEGRARQHALNLAQVQRLRVLFEQKVASNRAYVLSAEPRFLERGVAESARFDTLFAQLRPILNDEGRRLLDEVRLAKLRHDTAFVSVQSRTRGRPGSVAVSEFLRYMDPARGAVEERFDGIQSLKTRLVDSAHREARSAARRWSAALVLTALLLVVFGGLLAWYLVRSIRARDDVERRLAAEIIAQNGEMEGVINALRAENQRLKQAGAGAG